MQALILLCTLKPSPETSNTRALLDDAVLPVFKDKGVDAEVIRLVDLDIKPGVKTDMGKGDDWPSVHDKLLRSDILILATPTWMGQASSVCQRALERMDAMLSETRDDGRPVAYNKVAGVVVTGNEDGAHHIVGTCLQVLHDIGFTSPGQSSCYWNKGPGPGPDYTDTHEGHDYAHRVGGNMTRNLIAAAEALRAHPLPVPESGE